LGRCGGLTRCPLIGFGAYEEDGGGVERRDELIL
jgi:hypothetical protein